VPLSQRCAIRCLGVSCAGMEVDADRFRTAKEKAHAIYTTQSSVWCPYFKTQIVLNSDGFHHLQFSARRERNKREQLLKLRLVPLALRIIRDSGTVQEYRKLLGPIGKPSARGSVAMKEIEYWGFIGIVGEKHIKVRAVLRRVGTGNITFWSVMPYSKVRNGVQRMYTEGIEDE
jgi:hypothetical protein